MTLQQQIIKMLFQEFGYPETIEEVLDDTIKYKKETIAVLKAYKDLKPWSGTLDDKKKKLRWLHSNLMSIYDIQPKLILAGLRNKGATDSSHCTGEAIVLVGKVSVVTYLHEFAHALGSGERGACRWSLNLFKKVFPKSFNNATGDGHVLVAKRRKKKKP